MTNDTAHQSLGLIMRALKFAAAKHRDQRRKDVEASPYINHPIALAVILADEAGITDPAVICAALLHDTVEDTETTVEELVGEFGAEIAGIVAEVTDNKTLPKAERKRLQIEHARVATKKARLVKLADKIANLRDIAASPPADWDTARKQEYFDWASRVVDAMRGTNPELESLFDAAATQRERLTAFSPVANTSAGAGQKTRK
jgi:guanosine-3',5'-bis(diphosphate) 3'-pyrophosphohydrolase